LELSRAKRTAGAGQQSPEGRQAIDSDRYEKVRRADRKLENATKAVVVGVGEGEHEGEGKAELACFFAYHIPFY
jgi:hypothetical protein